MAGECRNQVPFGMAREKMKPVHKCFPKHLRVEAARMKEDKQTEEENK